MAAACAASFGGSAFAAPVATAALEALQQRVSQTGSARVIVGLDVATQREGVLNATQVLQQRANIRAAQRSAVASLLAGTGSNPHSLFETIPFLAAEVDAVAFARLRASPLVTSVVEDALALPTLLESTKVVHATTAWANGWTGSGWTVAILDTGVDKAHPFLAGKVVSEACYSTNSTSSQSLCPGGVTATTATDSALPCASLCSHGTHVAGIAAGGTRASDGMHGVATDAGVIAVQIFSLFPQADPTQTYVASYSSDQIKGLERVLALNSTYKIAAVNMSLGGSTGYTSNCDASYSPVKAAIDNLRSVGIATVIAAGNNAYVNAMSGPACISTAVSVGATCDAASASTCVTGVDGVASYSNISKYTSLVAPGSFITSSTPNGNYATWNGTSMATPHVVGAWAVLKQAQPTLSVTDALALFQANAVTVNDTRSGGTVTGLKRVDLAFVGAAASSYPLAVAKAGTDAANGTVTSADGGIDCGIDCSHDYATGTSVTLTAAPAAGSRFVGWSGACTGTAATCTVAMTGLRSVTATFNLQWPLTVTRQLSGSATGTVTSSPTGISCGNLCSASFDAGTAVTLTAGTTTGSVFTGWGGACSGTATTCTLSMSAAKSVTASFGPAPQALLTVTAAKGTSTASGSVTSTPAGISCTTAGGTCSASYAVGTSVKLTAKATSSWSKFVGWSGACAGSSVNCTVSMSAARNVTATFR